MTFNLSQIMKTAWEIRETYAAKVGCPVGQVLMGECLKMAWSQAKEEPKMTPEQEILNRLDEFNKVNRIKIVRTPKEVRMLPEKHFSAKGKGIKCDVRVAVVIFEPRSVELSGETRTEYSFALVGENTDLGSIDIHRFFRKDFFEAELAKPRFKFVYV